MATGRFSSSKKKKKKKHELCIRNKEGGINSKVLLYSEGITFNILRETIMETSMKKNV